ncbi:MAG: hypothetical protein OIN88_00525 [Candidatus Methanoperedens sp.]|nr:hypothetical protein [Candidatus Methanoperedens sp.]MCZ7359050.1 hypothetical protein [Candidatus Methanoperedens sp.]HLB70848.1 hypothetical protein [Candidatus Methanoperedens sp.]
MNLLEVTSINIENIDTFSHAFTGSSTQQNEMTLDYLFSNLQHDKGSIRLYHDLSSIFQIDSMSSANQILKARDELVYTKEPYRRQIQSSELLRYTSELIDKLSGEEVLFKNINKKKLFQSLSGIVAELPPEQLSISKDELTKRIEKIMAMEVMYGMLDDLTPEQIKDFDTAVKRRSFFK